MGVAGYRVDPEVLARLSPAERAEAEESLRVLEGEHKRNPLLRYAPHSKQRVFHSPPFPDERYFFGGNRSGKTTAAIVDTLVQAVDDEFVPEHLQAFKRWPVPFKCRVMTPDFGKTLEVVLTKIREWCPKEQLKGGSFDRAYNKVDRILWFKNESRIEFCSNVQDREQLGGSDLHRIVYDEEPRQELRNECAMRLADHDGEELFAMTPFQGMAWLFDQVFEPWERGDLNPAEQRVVVVDLDDNPHMSESGKRKALAKYSGPEREARKSGRFVSFAGLIYPQFDEDKHVLPDEEELPFGVECFEGIDPGFRIMAAVAFCYLDRDDRLVVYDELALQGKTIRVVAEEIRACRERWGVKPAWSVMDPAARNKNPQTGRSDESEFQKHGIFAMHGVNDVRPGISAVTERLDANSLLVSARCVELRKEFRRYRWMKDTQRTEGDPKDRPVKKDDHLLDALRYVVMRRPLAPSADAEPERLSSKERALRNHLKKRLRPRRAHAGFGPGQFT